jgi:hypothetical protein
MVDERRGVLALSPDDLLGVLGTGGASEACKKRAGDAGGGIDLRAGVGGLLACASDVLFWCIAVTRLSPFPSPIAERSTMVELRCSSLEPLEPVDPPFLIGVPKSLLVSLVLASFTCLACTKTSGLGGTVSNVGVIDRLLAADPDAVTPAPACP